jgi:hypothetical protein
MVPWFKYGMLAFIGLLACVNLVVYLGTSPEARTGATMNLVVTAMLAMNHASIAFLSARRQRQLLLPQLAFIGLGLIWIIWMTRR